jgi:ubiquinone/menaquinone biosynthesis C-methylase UbiE
MASVYESVAAPGLAGFYALVASEVTSALAHGRVLDVGTGPGHLLAEIARRSPDLELVGVDLSERMIRIARQVTQKELETGAIAGMTGVVPQSRTCRAPARAASFVRAAAGSLPFRDGAFELVVSTISLHHWRDPVRGIEECFRVTAPGGRCWIYDLLAGVAARKYAGMVTGGWLRRLVLSWTFKFHCVDPRDYTASSLVDWLKSGARAQAEVRETHLKLSVEKPCCISQGGATPADTRVAIDCGASQAGPAALRP